MGKVKNTEPSRRKTGVDVLGSIPWGMHVCLFYKTKEDLLSILVPYFKAGLESNEFCMWVTSEFLTAKTAENEMRKAVPNFDDYLKRGQIEIVGHSQWYLKEGTIEPKRILRAWNDKLYNALTIGYAGMRITGDTTWVEKSVWKNFVDYEHQMNEAIGGYRMVAICAYNLEKCTTSDIIDVVNNHKVALIRQGYKWTLAKNAERIRAEQKALEYQEQLKAMASALSLAEERERRRIADGIHDDIGTKLALAKFELQSLMEGAAETAIAASLESVCAAIDKVIEDAHSLTFELSNPVLYEVGLDAAVESWLGQHIHKESRLKYEVASEPRPMKPDVETSVVLFGVIRELLSNVIKHADANMVQVHIQKDDKTIQVSVEDDGVGFEQPKPGLPIKENGGFGLFHVRERVEYLGGVIEIESRPGEGTHIRISVPVQQSTSR